MKIRQQTLTHRGVFRRPLPEAQHVFLARRVDAERDHQAMLADVHAIDDQGDEVERI